MVDSRCGLHCDNCEWKEPCNCGGCIETNGHPFHGDKPIRARIQQYIRWVREANKLR